MPVCGTGQGLWEFNFTSPCARVGRAHRRLCWWMEWTREAKTFPPPLIRLLFEFSLFYFAPGGNYMLLLFLGTVCAMSVRPGTTYWGAIYLLSCITYFSIYCNTRFIVYWIQVSGVERWTMASPIPQLYRTCRDKAGRWTNQIQSFAQINGRPGE